MVFRTFWDILANIEHFVLEIFVLFFLWRNFKWNAGGHNYFLRGIYNDCIQCQLDAMQPTQKFILAMLVCIYQVTLVLICLMPNKYRADGMIRLICSRAMNYSLRGCLNIPINLLHIKYVTNICTNYLQKVAE